MNDVKYLQRKLKELAQQKTRAQYAEVRRSETDRHGKWIDLLALRQVDRRRRVEFTTEETTLTARQLAEAFRARRVKLI